MGLPAAETEPSGLRLVPGPASDLVAELLAFDAFGTATRETETRIASPPLVVPTFVNEFWTSEQRRACSLHEVSYRACFKPELPRFFIDRLTAPGDVVYDPFSGRGTTAVEAALRGRVPWACDVNPLSRALAAPRLAPPEAADVERRLREIPLEAPIEAREDLLVFYHADTLRAIANLREHFLARERDGRLDAVDAWIRMVALNRLTGHSTGFFSVYTLPPNQAVSVTAQQRINATRNQTPPYRDVRRIILRKTRSLLKRVGAEERRNLAAAARGARLLTGDCRAVPALESGRVALVVTSPPFLDVLNYKYDNWLRCWFIDVDPASVPVLNLRKIDMWERAMTTALAECRRLLRPGGHVAFEVGEVRMGSVRLEESALRAGVAAGLAPELVLINDQDFTKTANAWGVGNRRNGTNTNRIVLFRKP